MRRWVLGIWLAAAPQLLGWGSEGHELIARLAAARLSPQAAAQVAALLGSGATMASIASWADQVRSARRETGPWHYIDIPIDKPHLDMARDCAKHDCVIAKIEDFERVLADRSAAPEQRKEALMFLVHFVGDMHQPLHCSDNKDKGGNDVQLQFMGRRTNLHSLWDSGLLSHMPAEEALYTELDQDLTRKRAKKLAKGNVRSWAEESHKLGQQVVYKNLDKPIDATYEQAGDPIVKQQIERAAARLAKVLNSSLR